MLFTHDRSLFARYLGISGSIPQEIQSKIRQYSYYFRPKSRISSLIKIPAVTKVVIKHYENLGLYLRTNVTKIGLNLKSKCLPINYQCYFFPMTGSR